MWIKFYVKVNFKGISVSSGNFAILYFDTCTNYYVIDDHETGQIYGELELDQMKNDTEYYDTWKWASTMIDGVRAIVKMTGYAGMVEYDYDRIKYYFDTTMLNIGLPNSL
jgi:hypothetical protein